MPEYDSFLTSGTGVFNIIGAGGSLKHVVWYNSGTGSGLTISLLDTVSGTAASGLWVEGSGVKLLAFNSPAFLSGKSTDPLVVDYGGVLLRSGLAIMISGGAVNQVRALIVYNAA